MSDGFGSNGLHKRELAKFGTLAKRVERVVPELTEESFQVCRQQGKVRAELRRLLRKKSYQNGVGRSYLIGLRAAYHGSIRRERCR